MLAGRADMAEEMESKDMSEQLIINIVAEFKRLSAEDRLSFVLKTLKEIQDKDAFYVNT